MFSNSIMAGKFKDKTKRNKLKDHTSQPTEVLGLELQDRMK